MLQTLGTIRRFETPNFSVIVDAVEDYDVDLSWDDTGAVRAKLESGEYVCFTARARVYYKGRELADDYLGGGCIYASIEEFQDHRECAAQQRAERAKAGRENVRVGSYFADMVRGVCRAARAELCTMKRARVRC